MSSDHKYNSVLHNLVPLVAVAASFLTFGGYFYRMHSVPINGELRFIPTIEEKVDVPLQGNFDGLSLTLTGDELVYTYQKAEKNRWSDYTDFVDTKRIGPIADILLDKSNGDKIKYIQEVLEFINDNVKYDKDTRGYWDPSFFGESDSRQDDFGKFPIQTLYDKRGDCEDYSILAASFFAYAGIETGIAFSPNHAAVGFILEDQENLDKIIFDAAKSALGTKIKSTLGVTPSTRRVNVNLKTKILNLEEAIDKDIPSIIGTKTWFSIDVTDWKFSTLPVNVPCNKFYWLGDIELSFHEIAQKVNAELVRGTNQNNTIENILQDAITQKNINPNLDKILYRLPSNSHYFIAARPVVKLNNDSKCKPEEGGRIGLDSLGGSPVDGKALLGSIKQKRIFYLEPQRTGFTLHSQIPMAVHWQPLPKDKYPSQKNK
ncbi:transglutaminase domain-containing protein [Candidatus Woesearchaeota archaeon]|nr:transglutaminase domain-containing protein [Candidatus Woesearchaeota archaeon]